MSDVIVPDLTPTKFPTAFPTLSPARSTLLMADDGVKPGVISVGAIVDLAGGGSLPADTDLSTSKVISAGTTYARPLGDRFAEPLMLQDAEPGSHVVGTGDDLGTWNAAMAMMVSRGGGTLMLPAKSLHTAGTLTFPASNVPIQVIGQGFATSISPLNPMDAILDASRGLVTVEAVFFQNVSNFASAGVKISKPIDNLPLELRYLRFTQFAKALWATNGDVVTIDRPWTNTCGTSLAIDNGMLNSNVIGPYFLGGNGIDVAVPTVQQPEGLRIYGGTILPANTGDFGVRIRSGLEIMLHGVIIDQLIKAGANGVLIDSTNYAVRGIKIQGCWTAPNDASNVTGSGIKLIGGGTVQVHISDHSFFRMGKYGLEVDGSPGLCLDLRVTDSNFRGNTIADASIVSARAIFRGCNFDHPTASIITSGPQAQVNGIGNTFVANPMLGVVPGGFYVGNVGNSNDSWDGSNANIGRNARAGDVVATTLDVSAPSTFRSDLIVVGNVNIAQTLRAEVIAPGVLDASGTSTFRSDLNVVGKIKTFTVPDGNDPSDVITVGYINAHKSNLITTEALTSLFLTLPTTKPGTAGNLWLNNGVPTVS